LALLAGREQGGGGEAVISQSNNRLIMDVAKPLIFSRKANKISEFLMVCRLFIRMKIRNDSVKEQV